MSGLELLLGLDALATVFGLGAWYNKKLNDKVMVYYQPENKKNKLFDWAAISFGRRPVTKQDNLRIRLADGITITIRKIVRMDAFRQLMRALAMRDTPLRRQLGVKKGSL